MAVLTLFPQVQNTFLLPCKVFDTDVDIYFDIYQLCADKYAVTSHLLHSWLLSDLMRIPFKN